MKRYLIWLSLAALLTTGCAGNIQKEMRKGGSELRYSYGDGYTGGKIGTLEIRNFIVEDVLPSETGVRWTSGLILPLVLFNYWENVYQSTLGYNQIIGDYKQFMRESFIEEVNRRSAYTYVEHQGTLVIDLSINKIDMSASISGEGGFFLLPVPAGSDTISGYKGNPVNVDIQAHAVLKAGETTIFSRKFHGKDKEWGEDPIIPKRYTSSMIFGLSMAIKDLNANIVKAINQQQILGGQHSTKSEEKVREEPH